MLVRPVVIAMFLLFGATVRGQEPPAPIIVHATPSGAKLPEPLGKFTDTKPDLTLIPRGEGARGGRVWLRTVGNGLLIAGKVDGGPADFPKDQPQVLAKDHIEIWLAASPEVAMPQVGWVNYMDQTLLPEGPDSCAELYAGEPQQDEREKRCRDWAARQLRYRGYLKRLFLRQWLVAPGFSIEAFATPAYNEILQNFGGDQEIYVNDGPRLLKPRGAIQQWISGEPDGYFFQILIPFTALPPFSSLQLSDLYLMVDVFSAAPSGKKTGVYATSSPARVYGNPGTFNAVRIDPPVNYRLTPCNLPLQGLDRVEELSGNEPSHAAWFVPSVNPASSYESDAFILANDINSSRYEPGGLSPGIRQTHYFWQLVGPQEWACGPPLSYRNHRQFTRFPYSVSADGFSTKRLPDGDLLIKTGPRIYNWESNTACGACPRTQLKIFDLRKDGKIFGALSLGDTLQRSTDGLASQDFTLSADWSQVTQYDEKYDEDGAPGPWSSTTYCLTVETKQYGTSVHVYQPCGQQDNVQPPNPPVLKELRDLQN